MGAKRTAANISRSLIFRSLARHTQRVITLTTIACLSSQFFAAARAQNLEAISDDRGIGVEFQTTEQFSTGRRVALVIGNSRYESAGVLRNPVNDARDIAAVLRDLGFEVILRTDSDLRMMEEAVDEFYTTIQQGSVGVFYFAGHGVQAAGENYLLPIDANIQVERDLPYESLPLARVVGRMEAAENDINIVILDACRNNPFASSVRSLQRGLATVDAATGFFIAYATAPGNVADDGQGRNGTFTAALLNHIRTSNITVEQLFKRVRAQVSSATNSQQIPWTSSSLIGEFAFGTGEGDRGTSGTTIGNDESPQFTDEAADTSEGGICISSVCF